MVIPSEVQDPSETTAHWLWVALLRLDRAPQHSLPNGPWQNLIIVSVRT